MPDIILSNVYIKLGVAVGALRDATELLGQLGAAHDLAPPFERLVDAHQYVQHALRAPWRPASRSACCWESKRERCLEAQTRAGNAQPHRQPGAPRHSPATTWLPGYNCTRVDARSAPPTGWSGTRMRCNPVCRDETLIIPKADSGVAEAAISNTVEWGKLWLTSGPASILGEPIPAGVLNAKAELQSPPPSITVDQIIAEAIPDAWREGKTTALAISAALSANIGKVFPWQTIQNAIDSAIRAGWVALAVESGPWPCGVAAAQHVVLQVPKHLVRELEPSKVIHRPGVLVAEATLQPNGIQDLADVIPDLIKAAVGHELKFGVRIEPGGKAPPSPEVAEAVNGVLAEVSADLKLS